MDEDGGGGYKQKLGDGSAYVSSSGEIRGGGDEGGGGG